MNLNYYHGLSPNGDNPGDIVRDTVYAYRSNAYKFEANATKILSTLKSNPQITQKKLAELLGLSHRTISREIKTLREKGQIRRIGSTRAGYWEIM
jgi:predicted HTH transcriptional regulator